MGGGWVTGPVELAGPGIDRAGPSAGPVGEEQEEGEGRHRGPHRDLCVCVRARVCGVRAGGWAGSSAYMVPRSGVSVVCVRARVCVYACMRVRVRLRAFARARVCERERGVGGLGMERAMARRHECRRSIQPPKM